MSKFIGNEMITHDGFIVYGREASDIEKALSPRHECGMVMQFNKHGVLICPECRPQKETKHNNEKPQRTNKLCTQTPSRRRL